MKRVLMRADSSSTIGTGHIMRDLVLAEREFDDANIAFAVRDLPGNIHHKIEEAGYELIHLSSDAIEELAETAKSFGADTIVIDHYGIGYEEEKKLKELTNATLFVLDDTYERHFCDILLNHNVYADPTRYEGLVPDHCQLRCGAKHTLLRNEFVEAKQEAKKSSNITPEILVIMGGADTARLNLPILQTLAHCRPLVAHVVTTRANRHLSRLEAYANQNPWIRLHVESNRLAALMARVDVAIVTPSVTMNEIWYMELPFIVIQTAQNQRYMSDYLRQLGEPVFTTFDPNTMKKTLETYLDPDVPSLIHFGRLDEARLLQILKWRNAPQVRQWMHQKDPISANDHLAYVQSLHQRFDRLYFLARHRGDDIGVVDLTAIDRKERSAKIGLYAVPSKKGVGKLLMRGILQKSKMLGLDKLIAEVYATNERAIALYRRFGFEIHGKKWIDRKKLLIMECRV